MVKPFYVYSVIRYNYEESYTDLTFASIKDAYRRIIKLKYDYWQNNYDERLLYGKDTEFYSDIDTFYVKEIEVL